ncbi:MAG: DNA polymerase I [Bacillota bacterium]
MAKLLLLDGNSLMNRAFYALPVFTTASGMPTNAVYGFTMMLNRLAEDYAPDYWAAAFDLAAPTFRHREYVEYKAHRQKSPENLTDQFPVLKRLLHDYGVACMEKAGFEADDLIGTAAVFAEGKGLDVYIVTGDRDALQLVKGRIKVLLTRKGITEMELFDREKVYGRYGIWPEQVPDWKGLSGDTSDNIPGVPGIGDKSATQLLQEFRTLDRLLGSLDMIKKDRWRNLLSEHQEQARLSRRLATIDCEAPIELDYEKWKYRAPDPDALRPIYEELEFTSLLAKLGGKTSAGSLRDLFTPARENPDWALFFKEAEKDGIIYQYIFRENENKIREPVGVALDLASGKPAFLEYRPGEAREKWLECLGSADVKKICHDYKTQAKFCAETGLHLPPADDDTMLLSYLANAGAAGHELAEAARMHLRISFAEYGPELKDLPLYSFRENSELSLAQLAGAAVGVIGRLFTDLHEKIRSWGMESLYREVEIPLTAVLLEMEKSGVAVDVEFLKDLSRKMSSRLDELADKIFKHAGGEFNINSPKQLGEFLFERLKLPAQKKTKTGFSTDAEVLESLAEHHPVVRLILENRQLVKLKTTYVDVLPQLCGKDGRVHTSFNQAVTATGRLSSSNPNLQNIPIRTGDGREIRKAFIAGSPDRLLFSCDYSQIELRILAHLSQDPQFCRAFRESGDIHAYTAAEIFNVLPEDVTPLMRNRAKTVNFGILYGMSGYGLSRDLGIPRREAENYIASYFEKYLKVKECLERLVDEAREKGYAETILHRRRYLPDLHSRNNTAKSFAERTARNTPIQGSAADFIKLAMVRIFPVLRQKAPTARMILQVHDELVFEVHKSELDALAEIVIPEMEGVYPMTVPVTVDAKTGANWGEMTPYKRKR